MPDVVQWRGHRVKLRDVYFEPMNLGAGALGIRLLIPDISVDQLEHARAALRKAVSQMLGRREFAATIRAIEVATLSDSPSKYIALGDLGSFIQWWEARLEHARPKAACSRLRRATRHSKAC
jgi:hypothetical protein